MGDYGIYLFDAYDAGGDLKLHVRNRLNLFQTQKIQLWGAIPDGSEGLVTVRDEAGRDDEYVCVLMARGAYQQFEEYRYIPFTRIEYDPGY